MPNPGWRVTEVRIVSGLSGDLLCTCSVDATHTVQHLKEHIEKFDGTPIDGQRLLANGQVLQKNSSSIGDLLRRGISDFCLVRLGEEYLRILHGIQAGEIALEDLAEEFRGDYNIALAAVEVDGFAIQHVSDELKMDQTIVCTAVRESGAALEHVPGALRTKVDVVLAAVENVGGALQHAPSELRGDRRVALAAVRDEPTAIQFVSSELLEDRDFAMMLLKHVPSALRFMSARLQADPDIVIAAVSENMKDYANFADILSAESSLSLNRDSAFRLVRMNGLAIQFLPAQWKADPELLLTAMDENTRAVWYCAPELKHEKRFQTMLKTWIVGKGELQL